MQQFGPLNCSVQGQLSMFGSSERRPFSGKCTLVSYRSLVPFRTVASVLSATETQQNRAITQVEAQSV